MSFLLTCEIIGNFENNCFIQIYVSLFQIELNCLVIYMTTNMYVKKEIRKEKEYSSCKRGFNVFFSLYSETMHMLVGVRVFRVTLTNNIRARFFRIMPIDKE